jgi:phosphatidate cytidylyltransferase
MLKARILTAALLLAAFIAALFWAPLSGWVTLAALALAAAAWEWAGLVRVGSAGRVLYAAIVAAAGGWAGWEAATGSLMGASWLYVAAAVFWIAVAPLWLWERPAFGIPFVPLIAGIVILVPNAAALVALREHSPGLLLATMAVVWVSDTAAYFAGHRYGRRKLAPAISPGKTWEGVYGAFAAVSVYAIAWLAVGGGPLPEALRHVPLGSAWFVVLLLALAAVGIIGDLLESQMKRQAGVKDSGKVLPGHGGVLDRIDALLPVLPLAALAFLK